MNMDESRGFYYALSLLIYSRKSFKFINTLKFLKNEKMRSSLWLLLELSAGTIGEVIWNNQELLYKYASYSIIKCNMGEIIDLLDLFILKKITVTGEIIDRYPNLISIDSINSLTSLLSYLLILNQIIHHYQKMH